MALSGYLTITGQTQGNIQGSVTQAGREGSILVHFFNYAISAPYDPASGSITGRRQHTPLVIRKEIDRSSPLLWTALVNNEVLTSWTLRFYNPTATGTTVQNYTIALTDARIVSIEESMADTAVPDNQGLPMREDIAFTYQKIEWTWANGGVTAQDNWTA